jgi:peptide-methionine (S)-S-oxide reductase
MPSPQGKLLASVAAALLSIGVGSVVATRSPAISAAPAVEPGPIARIAAPRFDPPDSRTTATAVLAGGCFWGVQGVFQHVKGVTSAVSGYSGGARATAHYETVGSGDTGHAESVRISYDPRIVSYGTLLHIFFAVVADPTTLNYQGPDHGSQYRTAIMPTTAEQKQVAERYIAQLNASGVWKQPIVTKLEPMRGFYPAEDYHQDYLARKPDYPYIVYNDLPKVAALRQAFPSRWREQPVLVKARGLI